MKALAALPYLEIEEAWSEGHAPSIVPCASPALSWEARNSFREGVELLGRGEPLQAITKLEEAVVCAPNFSNGYVGLGMAYAMDSRVYPALDSFGKAVQLDPTNFYAHFKLAQFCFKLRIPKRGYEEASEAMRHATTVEEQALVARILKEERQRESGGLRRPTWDKPFSALFMKVGIGVLVAAFFFLAYAFSR